MATNLLLRHKYVFRTGQEVRLRGTQIAKALLDDFQAPARHDGAAPRQIAANRVEDDLVALHRAQVFRIGIRPHLGHDLGVVPAMDIRQLVFGQIGIAWHRRCRRHLLLLEARLARPIKTVFAILPESARTLSLALLLTALRTTLLLAALRLALLLTALRLALLLTVLRLALLLTILLSIWRVGITRFLRYRRFARGARRGCSLWFPRRT